MILLDTDTVTHFAYGNANLRRKIEGTTEAPLAITIITRNEILRGRADSREKAADEDELRKATERFRQAEELLSSFLIVSFDDKAIHTSGYYGSSAISRKWAGQTCSLPALLLPTTPCWSPETSETTRLFTDYGWRTGSIKVLHILHGSRELDPLRRPVE